MDANLPRWSLPTFSTNVAVQLYLFKFCSVSNTYLGEFLAQLQQEGYSIFIVEGQVNSYAYKGAGVLPLLTP